ncbi:hypothetical protein GCM10022237_18740 [Nocardioides ginsengisoli]|uniref:Lipopolysaccharide biosynthesis protein n=1 Tax=Nocardioides ginsengisoli TaxID=363868 RepID=A0ABW3W7R0_9ACTN
MTGASLRRNVAAVVVGNGAYAICQFAMLAALARLTDSTEVGRYALALGVTAPLFLFAGLKLRQVQVTDVHGRNTPGEFLGLRIVMSVLALVASVGVALVAGQPPGPVTAVALNKMAEGQLDSLFGTLQRHEQMTNVARAQVARSTLGLVAFVAAVAATGSAAAGALALAAVNVLVSRATAAVVRRQGRSVRPELSPAALCSLAWLALPLGVSVALGSVLANVPRYLLQHFEGPSAVGVFAALAYVTATTGTVVQAVAESASPRLANQYAAGELGAMSRLLGRLVMTGAAIGLLGVVASWAFAAPVLRIVFGPEYAAHADVLVVLMVAATLQYAAVFVGTTVDAVRAFRVQAPLTALGLLTAIVAGWTLTRDGGLIGTAWSTVVTQVVLGVGHVVVLVTVLRPRLERRQPRHRALTGRR